jgi:polyphosphate kinase 2 (PPK2 family)
MQLREGTMAKKDKKQKYGEGNGAFRPNGAMCANGKANGSGSGEANGGAEPVRLGKECDYERELRRLQVELVKLQEWIRHEGLRVVVLFEGRDAAGKGGAIKRITESLNPRACRIAALATPTEREKTHGIFSGT